MLRDDGGNAKSVLLTGQVRADFGRQDAERKVRDFLDRPSLAIRNQIEVNGKLASKTDIMPGHQNELELNPVFLGCWRGTNSRDDTEQWLGGCPQAFRAPVTEELCLRKDRDAGFAITYQNASSPLPNFRDHTELVSSNGSHSIGLRSVGSYDTGLFASWHITYSALWNCDLEGNGSGLACRSSGFQYCNGRPWVRQPLHVTLQRAIPAP